MSDQSERDAWRELAIQAVTNLSRIVEEAEAMLRKAQERLRQLNDDYND
jgi:hypothetical protein